MSTESHPPRPKKKILMIASLGPRPYVGGIENVVETFVHSDLQNRYDILCYDTFRVADSARTRLDKVKYILQLFMNCRRFIKENKPAIVHIHFGSYIDFWKHAICLITAKTQGVKTVFHLHGGSFEKFFIDINFIGKLFIKIIFKAPDQVIALSQHWASFLATLVKEAKIEILFNPIDCEKLSPVEGHLIHREDQQFILLGRVGKHKGHYDVLKALPIVKASYPKVVVCFAGTDDEPNATNNLKAIVKEKDLTSNVNFLGSVVGDEKVRLLHTSSIMLLPSYGENMPLSVIEGMTAKLPVITTNVGALPEMLEHGKQGMLIDVGDYRNLAKCMIEMLSMPQQGQKMADKAYNKVVNTYNIHKIADQLISIYQSLLSPKS